MIRRVVFDVSHQPVGSKHRNSKMDTLYQKLSKASKALLTRKILIECDAIPYEFDNVSLRKTINWILLEASIHFRSGRPWGWPTHLQIEPSNLCNLKCALCPVTEGLNRSSCHMDFNILKKVIDDLGEYVFLIVLWDWGEPFLNPRIYDMISYSKERYIKIVSSTNGHIFAERDHAEQLVRSGIDSIIFAVDGVSQETYERYRQRGNLNTVIEGIREVVRAKRSLNSKTPLVNLRLVLMKHNEHEVPRVKELGKRLGVDVVTFKTLNPHDDGRIITNQEYGAEFMPEEPSFQRFKCDLKRHNGTHRRRNPCKCLWNCPTIHSNGEVCLCTFDVDNRYVLGNLEKENLRDIWRGSRYRKLRRQFRENYQNIPLCSDCTFAFEGGSLGTETIIETHYLDLASKNSL